MINHARTLLVNRSGGKQSLFELGEEFIPTDFLAQKLPPWLNNYWMALFGSSPDNTFRNYVADQIMRTVHFTEYEPYLFHHDSRITYDPVAKGPFAETQYSLSKSDGTGTVKSIVVLGSPVADSTRGRMKHNWSFSMVNGVVTITHAQTQQSVTEDVYNSNGSSDHITLPGANVKITFDTYESARADWDDSFSMSYILKPARDLTGIVSELESLRVHESNLFGTTVQQPYATFFSLWQPTNPLPSRLAGFILAMVFRLNKLRLDSK